MKVADKTVEIGRMQILPVGPGIPHRVIDFSIPIQYFTFRAPISDANTKTEV